MGDDTTKGFWCDPWHPHLWTCAICGATVNETRHTSHDRMPLLQRHRDWHAKNGPTEHFAEPNLHTEARHGKRADIDTYAAILCRTMTAEYHRTGSWTVPPDVQERLLAWFPADPPLERER